MNIFIFDKVSRINAQMHCDKHLRKMIVEYAQIMSTVIHLDVLPNPKFATRGDFKIYKKTHENHPATKWARRSPDNFHQLYKIWNECLAEYKYRFDKEHKTEELNNSIGSVCYGVFSSYGKPLTPYIFIGPSDCIPEGVTTPLTNEEVVESYRNLMKTHKKHLMTFTKREVPEWFKEVM